MKSLIAEIRKCSICLPYLEHGVRPVFSASYDSKIAIIGQAPGRIVHQTGKPWDDKSGIRLREWMKVSEDDFYNPSNFAIVPMGFCYPGKGKSGDLPPRKECAPQWHNILLDKMNHIELILLIGSYAQTYYLKDSKKRTLTDTVESYNEYLPTFFPLPHPSPRNNIWMKKNEWFKKEVIPSLQKKVSTILNK